VEVARFAAVDAVVLAILAEPNIVLAHAEHTIAFALAFVLGLVAQHTDKCIGHGGGFVLELRAVRS
jgi:hypothetical protein